MARPATPTALKLIRGTRKDRVNTQEPVPAGEVICPADMNQGARGVWDRLAPDLIAKKVLTSWDVDEFGAFCEAVAHNQQAAADLAEHGNRITVPVRELADGTVVFSTSANPAWQVFRESAQLMTSLGGRFGLSPADRTKLKVGDAPKHGKGEDLLSG